MQVLLMSERLKTDSFCPQLHVKWFSIAEDMFNELSMVAVISALYVYQTYIIGHNKVVIMGWIENERL